MLFQLAGGKLYYRPPISSISLVMLCRHKKFRQKPSDHFIIERSSRPSAADIRLANLGLDLKAVYLLSFKVTTENKLRCFQFKIIHNIIPTNLRLWQMKIKPSPVCNLCKNSVGRIEHLFWNCEIVMPFWKEVLKWWNQKREENIQNIKAVDVLYDSNLNHQNCSLLIILF